jgi:hypothetical protein
VKSSSDPPIPPPPLQREARLTRLLLIDDDPIFRLAETDPGTEALEILRSLQPDAVDLIVLELASDRSSVELQLLVLMVKRLIRLWELTASAKTKLRNWWKKF